MGRAWNPFQTESSANDPSQCFLNLADPHGVVVAATTLVVVAELHDTEVVVAAAAAAAVVAATELAADAPLQDPALAS